MFAASANPYVFPRLLRLACIDNEPSECLLAFTCAERLKEHAWQGRPTFWGGPLSMESAIALCSHASSMTALEVSSANKPLQLVSCDLCYFQTFICSSSEGPKLLEPCSCFCSRLTIPAWLASNLFASPRFWSQHLHALPFSLSSQIVLVQFDIWILAKYPFQKSSLEFQVMAEDFKSLKCLLSSRWTWQYQIASYLYNLDGASYTETVNAACKSKSQPPLQEICW